MRAREGLALVATAALLALFAPPGASEGSSADWKPTNATKVAEGLRMPVDLAFGPDGSAFYVELEEGNVRRVDPETGRVDRAPVATVRNHNYGVERGVFGLAVDPDYARTRAIYVSYSKNGTEPDSTVNVLSRFVGGEETVLLERPGHIMHNGGRVLVVGDVIWLTTGDATPITDWTYEKAHANAQDPHSRAGQVMRLTKEGTPAPGNPWGNEAWSIGHRNVFGIAYDPETGRLIVTENGSERADEINLVEKGANYGWPVCAGPCDPPRAELTDPIVFYEATVGPTGATFFRGDYWFAEFNHGNVHRIREANGEWVDEVAYHYPGSPPRILDLEAHPDGQSLWFTTWDAIWRLDFEADPNHPKKDLEPVPTTPPSDAFQPPTNGRGEEEERGDTGWGIPAPGALAAAVAAIGGALALGATRRRRA